MGLSTNLRFAWQRLRGRAARCDHVTEVAGDLPAPETVCPACVAEGATWVHLRQCGVCGRTGCCDSSPNRHASRHAHDVGHPVLRSAESGEDWWWCVVDETLVERR